MSIPGNTVQLNESQSGQNTFYSVDSSGIHFSNQTITVSSLNNQQNLTITPVNYYPKNNTPKHNNHQNTHQNSHQNNHQNTITLIPTNSQISSQHEKVSKSTTLTNVMEIDTRHISNQISSTHGQNVEKMHHNGRNVKAIDVQRSCNNIEISSGNSLKRISVSSANGKQC